LKCATCPKIVSKVDVAKEKIIHPHKMKTEMLHQTKRLLLQVLILKRPPSFSIFFSHDTQWISQEKQSSQVMLQDQGIPKIGTLQRVPISGNTFHKNLGEICFSVFGGTLIEFKIPRGISENKTSGLFYKIPQGHF